jgi:hypothetical protein
MGDYTMRKGIKQGTHVATVTCARCGQTVNKKKTLATQIFAEKAYNETSKLSYRGLASQTRKGGPTKRSPSIRVVRVTRMCRVSCGKTEEQQPEPALATT